MQHHAANPVRGCARAAAATMLLAAATAILAPTSAQQQSVRRTTARSELAPIAFALVAEPGAPEIDGMLDDPSWLSAVAVSDFTQTRPNDGEPATERTEVRITYDRDALYVSARMYDSEPHAITSRLGRRDSHMQSDLFYVMIDSYHDHRTTFRFSVNPAGVRGDLVASNDNTWGDDSWDPVWEAATLIDSLGWTAELRIPFSQLRFSSDPEQVWGINFSRTIFRKDELVRWSWAPNTDEGYASLFGHLQGLRDIPAPRRIEVLPYTVATTDFTEGVNPDNPFKDGSMQNMTAGFDMKYGVTSDLTLDATVNPDFGQVEADPAVVNLSAFETYFSERRPFFVEGANIFRFGAGSGGFSFGAPQLFYSRRIGRRPSRSASVDDGFADNPISTRILGATKVSGQTGGWSIGLLDAVSARTSARIQKANGSRATEPVEPLTNYGVLSLRRDMRDGASGIGIMATSVNRRLDDPVFNDLRSSAYAGGVDFFHKFGGNQFALNGSFSGSRINGSPDVIASVQESSARYYQRPDQGYVSIDSTATSLSGWAVSGQGGKVSGNWTYGVDFYAYSPGLEVNDAGFETQVDRIFQGTRISRRWMTPGKVFRRFDIDANLAHSWNFGGTRQWSSAFAGMWGQFLNYWDFGLFGNFDFAGMSDKATRGGPLMENPGGWNLHVSMGTDHRKPVSFNMHNSYGQDEVGGWSKHMCGGVSIRPSSAISMDIHPSWNQSRSMSFYVDRVADPTATATFGTRYLNAELVRTSISAMVRVDVALSPDLSIQLYAQPYLAAGDYETYKELAAPSSFDFLRYGVDGGSTLAFDGDANEYTADPDGTGPAEEFSFENPDFRYRSLRSNLVLRWEYMPGSTLFLVWNHGQSGSGTDPTFRMFDQLGSMFGDDQKNTFLVKVNYWLSR